MVVGLGHPGRSGEGDEGGHEQGQRWDLHAEGKHKCWEADEERQGDEEPYEDYEEEEEDGVGGQACGPGRQGLVSLSDGQPDEVDEAGLCPPVQNFTMQFPHNQGQSRLIQFEKGKFMRTSGPRSNWLQATV